MGDSRLSAEPPEDETPDTYLYDPRNPVPTWGGPVCCTGALAPGGPLDQRVNQGRQDVLVFSSDPLDADTEVTEAIQLRLFFSTNVPDTDFFATVSDAYPGGRAVLITQGTLRTRFRESLTEPTMLTPGEVHEVTLTLWETSNVFKARHRIRLHITSSDFPRFDRNLNTAKSVGEGTEADIRVAEQVIYHDAERPSSLLLPVIPRRRNWAARSVRPPSFGPSIGRLGEVLRGAIRGAPSSSAIIHAVGKHRTDSGAPADTIAR